MTQDAESAEVGGKVRTELVCQICGEAHLLPALALLPTCWVHYRRRRRGGWEYHINTLAKGQRKP